MHFYEATDNGIHARHFVEMTTREGLRPSRISDARKAWREGKFWVPSVTTVQRVLSAPALDNWKIDQFLTAAFDCPQTGDCDEWIREAKRKAELQMDKAPQAGTDMHKVLESYIRDGFLPQDKIERKICRDMKAILTERCGDNWLCENYFTHPLGFGGCMDLSKRGWKVDHKTKKESAKFKPGKMAYDDHRMQLAAYRVGDNDPTARCANTFIDLETGAIDFHEHTSQELEKGWQMFQHALAIWQLRNDWPADLAKAA